MFKVFTLPHTFQSDLEHQQFFKSEPDQVWSDSEVSPIDYS